MKELQFKLLGMKIPKKVKIMGKIIDVEWDKELVEKSDSTGEAHYRFNKIVLQPNVKGYLRDQQEIDITFFHELIHFVLDSMEESDLRSNEKFVGLLSSMLYQVLKDNKLGYGK
jgi:hypothetical protein